jgi:hypothetical protein
MNDMLSCVDTRLDPALLDAIDAIVAPGVDVIPNDPSTDPNSLLSRNRRR